MDFQQEKTVLEKLFIRYGHFVLASPRYRCLSSASRMYRKLFDLYPTSESAAAAPKM